MEKMYLIRDLAHITGHSIETIKYYLKIGLIKEMGKTPETNYRYFGDATAEALNKIRSLRVKGMSIAQIKGALKEEGKKS